MKKEYIIIIVLVALGVLFVFFKDDSKVSNNINMDTQTVTKEQNSEVKIYPISHATMVIAWDDKTIYVDPVGKAEDFKNFPKADLVLVTHMHPDHFSPEIIALVSKDSTRVIVPQSVFDELKSKPNRVSGLIVMNNKEKVTPPNISVSIEAVPAYNISQEQQKFHPKGRDNGYVLEKDGFRIYMAGDTSGTPEMRALKDIDIAFVPMNLPYTMTVEEAANAVLDFKPKQIWPYHYRGTDGLSDVAKFKDLVNKSNPNIEVILAKWY